MEPLKEPSNVTRLPGAEDARLREPPHNFEAEQALLGSILVNNAAYQRVAEFLRPEHFADPAHGKLYDSLSRLIERGQVVSAVTLKTYVEQDPAMKEAGGAAYLKSLSSPLAGTLFCPTGGISLANARDYLSLPNVVCVGGSWVAPKELVAKGDWAGIEKLAAEAAALKG